MARLPAIASTRAARRGGITFSARREVVEQNRIREGYERKLVLNLLTAFAEIGDSARDEFQLRRAIDLTAARIPEKLRSILEPHYRSVIDEFGLRMLRYRKEESQFETLIREYFAVFGAAAIRNISETTRRDILAVILAGDQEALGVAAISQMIFDRMRGGFARNRAATIARTETHNAASYANHEIAKTLDLPGLQKQWVSVSDDRTRSHHAQLNGTKVALDDDFIVPYQGVEYRMARPGDPRGGPANVINCRCALIYVADEDTVLDD